MTTVSNSKGSATITPVFDRTGTLLETVKVQVTGPVKVRVDVRKRDNTTVSDSERNTDADVKTALLPREYIATPPKGGTRVLPGYKLTVTMV